MEINIVKDNKIERRREKKRKKEAKKGRESKKYGEVIDIEKNEAKDVERCYQPSPVWPNTFLLYVARITRSEDFVDVMTSFRNWARESVVNSVFKYITHKCLF